jgi:hypothetical protein
MRDTYLVQRLTAKPKSEFHAAASKVFGGGMVGMSEEGWQIIHSICNLAYMGAAEYEFGVIPSCLSALAIDSKKLAAFPLTIKRADIQPNWAHQHRHNMARMVELAKAKKDGVKAPRA